MSFSTSSTPRRFRASAVSIVALALGILATSNVARADFKVRSPNVDYRELEIENNTSTTFDKRPEQDRRNSLTQELGFGILPNWQVEIEGEFGREPSETWQWKATTFENTFMITEPGKYFLDFGIFAEYSRAKSLNDASTVKFGTLLKKDVNKFINTFNVYLEKEVGPNAGTADNVSYAWQTRYRFNPLFQPGIEIYGQIADVNNAGKFGDRQLRIGPVVAGQYNLGQIGGRGKIKYEVGYLFGVTSPTEQGTLRTRLELEIPF